MLPIVDAVVTLDPYTRRTDPRIVARAATAESERNLLSLPAPRPRHQNRDGAHRNGASHHSESARA